METTHVAHKTVQRITPVSWFIFNWAFSSLRTLQLLQSKVQLHSSSLLNSKTRDAICNGRDLRATVVHRNIIHVQLLSKKATNKGLICLPCLGNSLYLLLGLFKEKLPFSTAFDAK